MNRICLSSVLTVVVSVGSRSKWRVLIVLNIGNATITLWALKVLCLTGGQELLINTNCARAHISPVSPAGLCQ